MSCWIVFTFSHIKRRFWQSQTRLEFLMYIHTIHIISKEAKSVYTIFWNINKNWWDKILLFFFFWQNWKLHPLIVVHLLEWTVISECVRKQTQIVLPSDRISRWKHTRDYGLFRFIFCWLRSERSNSKGITALCCHMNNRVILCEGESCSYNDPFNYPPTLIFLYCLVM